MEFRTSALLDRSIFGHIFIRVSINEIMYLAQGGEMSARREEAGAKPFYNPPRIDSDLYQAVIPPLEISVEEHSTPPKDQVCRMFF